MKRIALAQIRSALDAGIFGPRWIHFPDCSVRVSLLLGHQIHDYVDPEEQMRKQMEQASKALESIRKSAQRIEGDEWKDAGAVEE